MTIDDLTVEDVQARVASFHTTAPDEDLGYPLFNAIRDKCPVAHSELYGGFWVLSTYDDIREAMKHPEIFSSTIFGIPPTEGIKLIPLNYDPPDHTYYRNQFASLLGPAQLRPVAPKIRARMQGLLKSFVEGGGGDFVAQVAVPYPCVTFIDLLGLPAEDLDQLLDWKNRMIRAFGNPDEMADVMANVYPKLHGYFGAKLAERAAMADDSRPPDLIDAIVKATHRNGDPFTDADKIMTFDLFFQAGFDTVTGLLGFIVEFLAANPDHRRQLVEEPELIPNAVEEFFRYFGIVTTYRKVMRDTEINGVTLNEGDYAMILFQAAGRDPSAYAEPETVDFRRANIRHLGLGGGPHRCLGSHLARLELQIALEEMASIMPEFSIDGDPSAVPRHWGVVAGVDALPLVIP